MCIHFSLSSYMIASSSEANVGFDLQKAAALLLITSAAPNKTMIQSRLFVTSAQTNSNQVRLIANRPLRVGDRTDIHL